MIRSQPRPVKLDWQAMMQLSTTKFNLIASILCCVLVACTAVQSLTITESDTDIRQVFEFHTARELKEDIFVTDPSANVEGKLNTACELIDCMMK